MRLSLLAVGIPGVLSIDNGLGLTPPMGYNTWYDTTCSDLTDQNMVRLTADLLLIKGLAPLGYEYVNLDDCYIEPGAAGRVNGTLQPDAAHFGGVSHGSGMMDRWCG